MKRFRMFAVLLAGHIAAVPAFAGVADSPLPELETGKRTLHLYSVPGVMAINDFQAYFSCTSTDTAPMQVGVELFGGPGGAPYNDATATSLTVNPGATVIFGTTGLAIGGSIFPNVSLGGFFSRGSARILATSKKLACNAFVAEAMNYPTSYMVQLTIIKGTKQKGD